VKLSHEPSKDKLYFISHPLFTFGDPDLNRKEARQVELKLDNMGIYIINPLSIIPPNTPEPAAMGKCDRLLKACDGIILCQNWRKSNGCRHEKILAEEWELEIIEIEEG
jgi:hypothetical protein